MVAPCVVCSSLVDDRLCVDRAATRGPWAFAIRAPEDRVCFGRRAEIEEIAAHCFDPLKIGSALEHVVVAGRGAEGGFDPLKIGSALEERSTTQNATRAFGFDPLKIGSALEGGEHVAERDLLVMF